MSYNYSVIDDNPIALYDADPGNVVAVDGYVATWYDRSNNLDPNRNATQATPANRPLYTANDADFNGHGSLNCATAKMITGTFSIAQTQPVTIYSVSKVTTNAVAEVICSGLTSDATNMVYKRSTQALSMYAGSAEVSGSITHPLINIMCHVFNGASSILYLNSAIKTYAVGNAGAIGFAGLTIGSDYSGVVAGAKIACIAIFSGVHTTEQRTRIMKYLSNKYGIAIDQPLAKYNADAGGYTVSSGTSVNALFDQSIQKDTNRNAIQATVGNQPTLTINNSLLNNQGTITCVDPQALQASSWSAVTSQPFTIYACTIIPTAHASKNIELIDQATGGGRFIINYSPTGHLQLYAGTTVDCGYIAPNTNVVISAIFNGASSALYVNNSFVAFGSGDAGAATLGSVTIGNEGSLKTFSWTKPIAHLEIHSGSHDADTRTSIMEALGEKYGIAVNKPLAVYDGDLGITLNGSNVAAWADQSGQGDSNRNAIQGTAINQPLYIANDSDFNGHGSITGAGASTKWLTTGAFSSAITTTSTVYVVCKPNCVSQEMVMDGLSNTERTAIFFNTNGSIVLYNGVSLFLSGSVPNQKTIFCANFNGASSNAFFNLTATVSGNTGTTPALGLTLLAGYNKTCSFTGKIAYIAIYSGVHTTAQRAKIMKQLGVKYNIRILARPTVEFDGDKGITLNGSTVSAWADQSETNDANKNATQATAVNQPTYILNDPEFNDHGSLSFAANKKMITGVFTTPITQPSTCYFVYKTTGTGVDYILDGNDSSHRYVLCNDATGFPVIATSAVVIGTTNYKNVKNVHCVVFNGANSGQYINNSNTYDSSGAVGVYVPQSLIIGDNYLGTAPLNGKIAYIAIYSGVHSAKDRARIMNELSVKYNISTNPVPLAEYDGDKGITLNGSKVSVWADQSGRGDSNRNAIQNTAVDQPTYIANDPDFNGHASLSFNGKRLQTLAFNNSITQPISVYIIYKTTVAGRMMIDGIDATNRICIGTGPSTVLYLYAGLEVTGSTNLSTLTLNQCVVFNTTSTKVYTNNNSVVDISGSVGTNSANGITIGSYWNTASGGFGGKIAYLAIYQGIHSTSVRTRIMNELALKYNVPVA